MGSSSRKRSADHSPEPKTRTGRKKKDKKSKINMKTKEDLVAVKGGGRNHKNKVHPKNANSSTKDGSSLETTATAEGKQMAQVLSTFSKLEQSRFEAFRKASFPGDAIAKYVAHCLIHEQHRPVSSKDDPEITNSSAKDHSATRSARFRHCRPTKGRTRKPVLGEVVAPGQAGDITVVVSTLAKEYAQRIVLAARQHALQRRASHITDDDDDDDEENIATHILPKDILKAFRDRQARGLDPGFFLPASLPLTSSRNDSVSALLHDPEHHRRETLARSVATAAQEAYDKEQSEAAKTIEEDVMDIDDVRKDEDERMDIEGLGNMDANVCDTNSVDASTSSEDQDASELAMSLFSKHVGRMIARQHGITVVTTDDEACNDNGDDDDERKTSEISEKLPSISIEAKKTDDPSFQLAEATKETSEPKESEIKDVLMATTNTSSMNESPTEATPSDAKEASTSEIEDEKHTDKETVVSNSAIVTKE